MASTSELISRFRADLLSKLVTSTLGALLIIVLARLLTNTEYGLLYLTISFFAVAKLFSKFGVGGSASRYIAEFKEADPTQLPHIIRVGLLMTVGLVALVSLVVAIAHPSIAVLLGEEQLTDLLLLGIGLIVFSTLLYYVRKVLQGFEAIKISAVVSVIETVVKFVCAVGLVLLGWGAVGALMGYIAGALVASLTGLGIVYYKFYRMQDAASKMESGLARRVAEYSVPLSATNAAGVLDKHIDTVLVGFFLNPLAVSYYVVSKQVVTFIETPVSALGFSIAPTFAAEKSAGNIEHAAEVYESAFTNTLLLYIPAGVGIFLIAEPLIEIVFGQDYLGAVPVLQVLSIYTVLLASNLIAAKALNFLGRARGRAIIKGITSVLNVIFNIILIPRYGVVGAAYATIITYSLYSFANLYLIDQEIPIDVVKLSKSVTIISLISTIMGIAVYSLLQYISGLVSLLAVITTGLLIWAALSTLTGFIDREKILTIIN